MLHRRFPSCRYEYVLRVVGRGIRPGLHFSFQKHDFGPCFITPAGRYHCRTRCWYVDMAWRACYELTLFRSRTQAMAALLQVQTKEIGGCKNAKATAALATVAIIIVLGNKKRCRGPSSSPRQFRALFIPLQTPHQPHALANLQQLLLMVSTRDPSSTLSIDGIYR